MSPTPPGPRLPALVQTLWLLRDPVGFLDTMRRRHGPVFRVRFLGYPRYVYVGDPALARTVYAADRTVGRAGPPREDFLAPLVGEHSLLCLEGDAWLRQRKLVGPAFHRRNVDPYAGELAALAGDAFDAWDVTEPFAVRPRLQDITLEVILRIVFGVTDEARRERLRALLPQLIDGGASPALWLVPRRVWRRLDRLPAARRVPSPLRRFLRLRDAVDRELAAEVAERRAGGTAGRTDVLTRLLDARDEDGRPMDDAELRDQLVTLLEAGHETTATALAWAVERLARTPHVLRRLQASIAAGDETYLDAVVRETLRARAVVLDTPRLLAGPLEVGPFTIPEGWHVAPALPLVQRAAELGDPEAFRPERWLGDDAPRDAWVPFGGGKRHCVGSHLALLELRVVLRELVARFDLTPVDPAPEASRTLHVTLVPAALGRVHATRRPGPERSAPVRADRSGCPVLRAPTS